MVTIAQIEPKYAVISQRVFYQSKHVHHLVDKFRHGSLKPDLPVNPIVAQAPIRRRGHAALNGLWLERL